MNDQIDADGLCQVNYVKNQDIMSLLLLITELCEAGLVSLLLVTKLCEAGLGPRVLSVVRPLARTLH